MPKTITLEGVEYELVPVYDMDVYTGERTLKGYLIKPTEVN